MLEPDFAAAWDDELLAVDREEEEELDDELELSTGSGSESVELFGPTEPQSLSCRFDFKLLQLLDCMGKPEMVLATIKV